MAGGSLGPYDPGHAELYDPATQTWSLTAPMSTLRHSHAATLLYSGQVLVAGGVGAETSAEL